MTDGSQRVERHGFTNQADMDDFVDRMLRQPLTDGELVRIARHQTETHPLCTNDNHAVSLPGWLKRR
jgi:hypothetical protein